MPESYVLNQDQQDQQVKVASREFQCVSLHWQLDCLFNTLSSLKQRKRQSSASLPIIPLWEIPPVDFPHKGTAMRKAYSCHDVIMKVSANERGRCLYFELCIMSPLWRVHKFVILVHGRQGTIFRNYRGCCWPSNTLQWRHNGRNGVAKHRPNDCLLNRLFRHRSKKTSKFRVTGLCEGNSPVTGEFPAQMASNAESVSIWWRRHDLIREK